LDVPRRPARPGFTLVEVLLALAILGIGVSVLIATTARCLSVARKARHYETARHLLDRVELEHPFDPDDTSAASAAGSFGAPDDGYAWSRTATAVGEEEDRFYEVRTRIAWSERGYNAGEEVVTYVYAPKPVEGGSLVRPPGATAPAPAAGGAR
jgi:prepilin-type N-terminal cleavage/methylation domain-containing protein